MTNLHDKFKKDDMRLYDISIEYGNLSMQKSIADKSGKAAIDAEIGKLHDDFSIIKDDIARNLCELINLTSEDNLEVIEKCLQTLTKSEMKHISRMRNSIEDVMVDAFPAIK